MKVGKIVEVARHPDADSLYVSKIDVGEPAPRTVVSGLVNFIPIEEMQNRKVVVLCNLKPQKMRGIESQGMVLCASVDEPTKEVEPLIPPADAEPGERIYCQDITVVPDSVLNPKKKVWEKIQIDLNVNENNEAEWKGSNLQTASGLAIRTKTMKNAPIK